MGGYAYAGDNPVTTGVYASGCATGTANGYEPSDDEAAADAAQSFSEAGGTDYVYILGEANKSGGNPKVKPSWREGPDREYTRGNNADEPYVLPLEEGQGVSAFLTPRRCAGCIQQQHCRDPRWPRLRPWRWKATNDPRATVVPREGRQMYRPLQQHQR